MILVDTARRCMECGQPVMRPAGVGGRTAKRCIECRAKIAALVVPRSTRASLGDGNSKVCYRCDIEKPLDEFYFDKARLDGRCSKCKDCDRELGRQRHYRLHPEARSNEERRANPIHVGTSNRTKWRIAGTLPRLCKDCRDVEVARPLWLCVDCKLARVLARTGASHRRRARLFGVEYEVINRHKVFNRDAWRCGICHRKIRPDLAHPHPRSASLDHIVPMSLGGPHLYSNVQPAHLECNLVKGHRGAEFQPLLFG